VFQRRFPWLAAVVAIAVGSGLAVLVSVWSPGVPSGPAARQAAGPPVIARAGTRTARTRAVTRGGLAACEQRLDDTADRVPALAVVGASYTAGVGPGNPAQSWAVALARVLRWNAVIDGVPGVGYARTGTGGQGPVLRMLGREDLRALAPSLVIVQAGHDDIGVPLRVERRQVERAIAFIRAAAPRARIAVLTVFTAGPPSAAARHTDRAIVSAAVTADGHVIVLDPLTGGWTFQHSHRGLHPTAAGDAWIAGKVVGILRAHGVRPAAGHAALGGSAPVICDFGIHPRRGPGKAGPAREAEAEA
jgi:acyl-CoA thioesterase I